MPYFTMNIGEKIEGNGFKTEEEARAYCRKASYPMFVIFEGTFDDLYDNVKEPIAIYLHGQGFNLVKIEKDVPYTTYRLREDKLPQSPDFLAINLTDISYSTMRDTIDAAFDTGKKLIWIIMPGSRFIDVYTATNRKQYTWKRVGDTIDGGDVIPDYQIAVEDLFDPIIVE